MSEVNPYTAPKADVHRPGVPAGRPGWVWAIFIFYLFSAVSTLASFALLMSGTIPIPEDKQQYMASLTATDYAFSFIIVGINVVAAILLFRLRKASFHFFLGALLLSILYTALHTINTGWLHTAGGAGVLGMIIGYGVKVAVCVYTWRLLNAGVLK